MTQTPTATTDDVDGLKSIKDAAFAIQEPRHENWTESYLMYRDKVVVNRLLQRQSINLPLMKMTIRTLLSKFKKKNDIVFEDYGNDKQKDVFKNAYWQYCYKNAKLKARETVDKKQVMLYGRSFRKLRIEDGEFKAEVLDPQDVLISRYTDPADIDGTAQAVVHLHIYKPLKDLENNPMYDGEAVKRLATFHASIEGVIKAAENSQAASEKNERMEAMGVPPDDGNMALVGQTLVELNEYYVRLYDDKAKKQRYFLVTMADDQVYVRRKPLQEVLDPENLTNGYWDNHIPIVTWGDDIERTDLWSDGVADIIRTIGKVLNTWISQLVENRTLRNFGMNFYDATANTTWNPSTMEARPFGWYPLPGKPSEVFTKVEIPDLSESLDEMQFLITMAEQSTAATATTKGTSEKTEMTLGEIKLMLVEAEDRISDMEDPCNEAQLEFGEKWSMLVTGMSKSLKPVKLFKKGYRGNFFKAEVKPEQWLSTEGYGCSIKSAAEAERDQVNGIQKIMAVAAQFPGNMAMKRIKDKRVLELADLNPEEVKEVETEEEQLTQQRAAMQAVMQKMGIAPGQGGNAPPGANPEATEALPALTP